MQENLLSYCNILIDIQNKGKLHLESLKEMRYTCAFQSEIESAKLAVLENPSCFTNLKGVTN